MVIVQKIEGYDSFCDFLSDFDSKEKTLHLYFTGSWCSDCIKAKPVIEKCLQHANDKSYFVYVDVGDRPTWKDPNCPFRTDSRTKLLVIPTLVRWKGPQKLSGEQCENEDLVEMLLTDD